jgi:valyl-tRNA synthetase
LPIINIFNKNAEVLAEFEYIAKAGEQISKTILHQQTILV